MKTLHTLFLSVLISWFFYPLPAVVKAHHAPYLYDSDNLITLEGVFVKLRNTNPHSKLSLNIMTEEGKQELWIIGLPSPGILKRQGNDEALRNLMPGENLIIQGWTHKLNSNEIRSHKITFPNGITAQTVKNNFFRPNNIISLTKFLKNPQNIIDPDYVAAMLVPHQIARWIKEDHYIKRLAIELNANRSFFIGLSENNKTSFIGIKDHLSCLPNKHAVIILAVEEYSWLEDMASIEYISTFNQLLGRHLERTLLTCGD